MELATIIQIFISIFAVFGIYAFLREICRAVGSQHKYYVAVHADNDTAPDELYNMLYEAVTIAESDARFKKTPVVFLSDQCTLSGGCYEMLEKWNVRICKENLSD
jgi:hypothetical protein